MSRIILCIIVWCFCVSVKAQTFNGTGGNIPDGGAQTCFNINVTGVGTINGTFGLASVCININHTWVGDLTIYLQSPTGTIIPLSVQNGFGGANYTNTCFTGNAATAISDGNPPFTGNFLGEEPVGTFNNGQNANGIWKLCIQDVVTPDDGSLLNWSLTFNTTPAPPPVIPANDDPCNAIPLTVGASCTYQTFTTEHATAATGVPVPGCASYAGGDVWFQAIVPAGGALIVDTKQGIITDGGMALYTGTCGSLSLVACDDDGSNNGLMPMITAGGLVPGSTIWIRVWEFGNDHEGTFGICVRVPPPPPANDDPCNATPLTVNSSCIFTIHSNEGATGSAGVPAPGCGDYQGADVWFSAIVPPSGNIFFDMNTGSITDGDMAVYRGTCNGLILVRCDDASSNNGFMGSVTLTGQVPGTTLWIRVWGNGSNNTGTFGICVSLPPPPNVQDCPAALPICQNVFSEPISYTGTGTIPNEINENNSCLSAGERSDVWYTFTVQSTGNLGFTITPNLITEDYDWAVYNLTNATCADIFNNPAIEVSCNFSGDAGETGPNGGSSLNNQGAGGTPYNAVIPVVAGQTFVINVSNYSLSTNGYTIDFSASTASIFDNGKPYLQSVHAATTCGGNKLTVNFSENVLCNTIQNADFTVTGPGGPYTVTGWESASCTSGATYGNNITLTISPPITTNGAFQVCLTNAAASVADLCGNIASQGCLNFNVLTTVPVFTPIAAICMGSTPPVLPAISLNGITGTWLPATISNTTSGTYTFSPGVGQCASQATLTVTVTPAGTVPVFSTVAPICKGATAPLLPALSNNGIAGTWLPATVSNITTGTYTFTPSPGQCATSVSMTVVVNNISSSTSNISICNNQLPYLWNAQSYSGAGTYSVTLISSSGCDSIATLNLSVNNSVSSTTNISICNNQLPYLWNGQSYSGAGTYSVTLTSASGCDSIATLNLNVNNSVTSTTNISICNNQLPYLWNGQSFPGAGSYSVTLISSSGCDSIATLNLSVNNSVSSTTNISICNNQLPYLWNGQSYPGAGTYSATLISSSGCDSIATLNLIVNNIVTSTTNISICNNQLPYSWNGQSYPGPGSYFVTLTSSSGCDSIATLNLNVNNIVTSTTNISICNNQLPYLWNGQSYPGAGTYSVTLISTSGCDSIATLNLAVNNSVSSTTNISICNNQLPYLWNGQSYPGVGTYSVTLTSSSGCDSIATLNLSVNNSVSSTTNISICNNQLPYLWNGQTYSTVGSYSVTLTSARGCDSIATLNLAVNNSVSSTTNVTICNNQLPYLWNGQSYSGAGTYSATLINASGCDSIATLNLIVNNSVTSTTNISICNNQLPYSWNGQSYPGAGTYSATLISSSGCDSIATLNLNVNNIVTSTTNISMCNNQLPYSWNAQSYSGAGSYSVTLTSARGCDSIATLNLSVNNSVTSTINISICNNQMPFLWNGQSYSGAGTYSVTVTSSSGCDSIATLNLNVNNSVSSTTNISICNNQLPYLWNGQSYPGGGTYSVTLTSSSGCDSIATLNLNVNNSVSSTVSITICNNQLPYLWNGQSYSGVGSYSVILINSNGCDSIATLNLGVNNSVSSTTNISICNNQLPYLWNGQSYPGAGTYSVTLTSSSGCDSIATLNLSVNNSVTSTTNISICNNQLPYLWNAQSYPGAGTYSVTLTSASGCDSIATLNLIVNNIVSSTTNISICNNQLPYLWNAQTYSTAGSYSVILINSNGCDSIATLNLGVNNSVSSTTNISICNNQLPFLWNSQSYAAAGTYSVTLISTSGCDSIATLNLSVNNSVSSTTDIIICNNQLPYLWNAQAYAAAGTYSVTLISTSGCDSVATLHLTINNSVSSTTNISICNNQLPFLWNGQTYSAAGSYAVTLTSSSGCDSIATLNLSVTNSVSSTTNFSICNNQLPYLWNAQLCASAGNYSVTLNSASGCDSIATLNLIINNSVFSTVSITICNNQLPYMWNGQSYAIGGSYSVTLISSNGCDSIATLNLNVNNSVSSTTNISICNNQLPYLWNSQSCASAGNYSVTLTSASGCDSIAQLNLAINNTSSGITQMALCSSALPFSWNAQLISSAGTYTATLVGANGCDSVATLVLQVMLSPAQPIVSTVNYCVGQPAAALTASGQGNMLWYSSASGGTAQTSAPIPSTAIPGQTNYYVSQVVGSCESKRAALTVNIYPKPILADKEVTICYGSGTNLTSLYQLNGLTMSWSILNVPVANPNHVSMQGQYQLIVSNPGGCGDTALVKLIVRPPVLISAGIDGNAEFDAPYQLSGSGCIQYAWSPVELLNNPNIASPWATLTENTTFYLTGNDQFGCIGYDSVHVKVYKGPGIYVPTAFTPNGDGSNDIFRPIAVGIVKLNYFKIYNRFAEPVFETADITKGWNGTYKGKQQPTNNFVWVLQAVDRKGKIWNMKGNVILIR